MHNLQMYIIDVIMIAKSLDIQPQFLNKFPPPNVKEVIITKIWHNYKSSSDAVVLLHQYNEKKMTYIIHKCYTFVLTSPHLVWKV